MIRFITAGKWIGLDDLAENELKELRAPSERAILKVLLLFEREVKRKLTGSRSGRIYIKGRRAHQASSPGEAPATDTGKLRQSITHDGPTWEEDEVSGEVGTSLVYAAILEYGGIANGARILPRPYMGSTFLEQQQAMQDILNETTQR